MSQKPILLNFLEKTCLMRENERIVPLKKQVDIELGINKHSSGCKTAFCTEQSREK